nr:uncharacterized protein LOC112211519 [Halyomorpha halys]
MKTLPLLCILACSWAEGEVSQEPNVVLQSVVLGKKPDFEIDSNNDDCRGFPYNNVNLIMRKLLQGLYPQQAIRYKREDSNYPGAEAFDDKTMERLLEALEELKEDAEKNPEDVKERDEDARKTRLDQLCRKGGKWRRKIEECQAKRRKGDMETYKRILKYNLNDFLAENKDLEKRLKKLNYSKKDWKDELERRRLKESLAESWPKLAEDRSLEDLYFPMPYHHQPSHHRAYPTTGYLP